MDERDSFIREVKKLLDELHPTAPDKLKDQLSTVIGLMENWLKTGDKNALKAARLQIGETIAANRAEGLL